MKAIEFTRKHFFDALCDKLNLIKVVAPIFIPSGTGIQDTLFKTESKIKFDHHLIPGVTLETLHSLAKWKRHILTEHKFEPHSGIYAEGHYLRGHEPELDPTHSLYVLQFDWEMTINKEDRNLEFLQSTVKKIYDGLVDVEKKVIKEYPHISKELPDEITFVHCEDLEAMYPDLTPKEREQAITKKHKAVFLIGIGHPLPLSGSPHDDRAADYDDWWSANGNGDYRGLNGDIIVWDSVLDAALELSSMGIRVSPVSLKEQSEMHGTWEDTKDLLYHKSIAEEKMVYSIGGGLGIDRINKWMLRKRHIGEVQVGIWPQDDFKKYPGLLS